MRRQHFEALSPVCPRCLRDNAHRAGLKVELVANEKGDDIIEGVVRCSEADCRLEYPIIDGIPILHPDLRVFLSENSTQILARQDLSAPVASLLGDALGPGSSFDITRQHLSTYAWDHYAEFDPEERVEALQPGGATRVLEAGMALVDSSAEGPILDLGCATGRNCFDLAGHGDDMVLGIDMSFAMLQVARQAQTEGRIRYPRRRCGIVYDMREFNVAANGAAHVDFWLCDSLALPFADPAFARIVALNLIDCVYSPMSLLAVLNRLLLPGGDALLATPFDWAPNATPVEAWIGGHSQRGPDDGASESRLLAAIERLRADDAGFTLQTVAQLDRFPWHARLHDRSTVLYSEHVQALRKLD